jgi:hypothetical protein
MRFLLPTGIGDSVWALHKIEAIRDAHDPGGPIDVTLVGGTHHIDSRAVDFVKRFSFVTSVNVKPFRIHKDGPLTLSDGTYNYLDDGRYTFVDGQYCVLIPNAALERGERLESWLPHHNIRWSIFNDFNITDKEHEYASAIRERVGPYAVFYPGPLAGNTIDGHNRGPLWHPRDWVELGWRVFKELGLQIVVVGASYDKAYWDEMLVPPIGPHADFWHSIIGRTSLGELWGITERAKFVISYQAGVGIISTYLGTPTGIFWRPYGDSISPSLFLSFNEAMASAWVPPKVLDSGTHLPLIYGRHGVGYIMEQIRSRGWV